MFLFFSQSHLGQVHLVLFSSIEVPLIQPLRSFIIQQYLFPFLDLINTKSVLILSKKSIKCCWRIFHYYPSMEFSFGSSDTGACNVCQQVMLQVSPLTTCITTCNTKDTDICRHVLASISIFCIHSIKWVLPMPNPGRHG